MANHSGNRNDEHDPQGKGKVATEGRHRRAGRLRPTHPRTDYGVIARRTTSSLPSQFRVCNTAAENLFLRKQLALFEERKAHPHRTTDAVRLVMSALGRLFEWRGAAHRAWSSPTLSSAGIGKAFACSGDGSRGRGAGPSCLATF
jgi:hypothetical protein